MGFDGALKRTEPVGAAQAARRGVVTAAAPSWITPSTTPEAARKRILVVEDEDGLSQILTDNLQFEGYDTEIAGTGHTAVLRAVTWQPDLITLDLTLPDRDGFELCRDLFERGIAPLIILSALSQQTDKVRGLEMGADDYVTKPFSVAELMARIRAVLRRVEVERRPRLSETLQFDDVMVDLRRGAVERSGAKVPFTQKEIELLRFLANNPGQAFTREELLQRVWGYQDAPLTRTVDTHIARLRHKLETDPENPRRFQTVYGTGYAFTP